MSSKQKNPDKYVCTLSPELLQKAKDELSEVPERREKDIQELRERAENYPGLHAYLDSKFLIRFLRARKFNIDRAFDMLLKFYQMRKDNPDIFENFQPSYVKHVLEDDVWCVQEDRNEHGCNVIFFRPGKWDPQKYDVNDVFRTEIMTLTKLIQDEETQVNGIVYILDLQGVSFSHLFNFTPSFAKKLSSLYQDSFPIRIKSAHVLHEAAIIKYGFPIIRPFLRQKVLERLHFHSCDYPSLHKFINPAILPEQYGGQKPPLSSKDWRTLLYSCEEEFIEEQKYGFDRLVAEYNPNEQDAMDTLVGSFRKLE